jgi:hypothetical protein
MKIKISNKHSVEYLDGYYLIFENAVRSPESKKAGEEYHHNQKSFARLTGALKQLKIDGECLETSTKAFEDSYTAYQRKESDALVSDKINRAKTDAKRKLKIQKEHK